MHRLLLALATTAALLAGTAFAQQQVRVTGVQIDELLELPPEMRLGVFLDLSEGARELGSVRMVAGTFDLDSAGMVPEERDLRDLVSGSFPLAFMIGNEFVVDTEGARFVAAWLQPYHDQNGSGAYEELFDEWFFRAPPELTEPFFGYFNLVYVDRDVVLRATRHEFELRSGWNLVTALVDEDAIAGGVPAQDALVYDVATSVSDVLIYSYGTNRTFENLERPEDAPEADGAD